VDGLQRAVQFQGVAQFLEGQVRLLAQQGAHRALMAGDDLRLAPGQVMAMRDGAGVAALLEEFFDHPQRYPETPRHVLARAFPGIVSGQNSLSEVQGNRSAIAHAIHVAIPCNQWLYYLLKRSSSFASGPSATRIAGYLPLSARTYSRFA
jgi:hypothetical protein